LNAAVDTTLVCPPLIVQGMLILCLAVGKMDISYPPSLPEELPGNLQDFLAK